MLGMKPFFITVEGRAELIEDKGRFAEHWTKDLDAWFKEESTRLACCWSRSKPSGCTIGMDMTRRDCAEGARGGLRFWRRVEALPMGKAKGGQGFRDASAHWSSP